MHADCLEGVRRARLWGGAGKEESEASPEAAAGEGPGGPAVSVGRGSSSSWLPRRRSVVPLSGMGPGLAAPGRSVPSSSGRAAGGRPEGKQPTSPPQTSPTPLSSFWS